MTSNIKKIKYAQRFLRFCGRLGLVLSALVIYNPAFALQFTPTFWKKPNLPLTGNVYGNAIVGDSPNYGYWRLGEASGTTAADSSTAANAGTYTGGYTFSQGGALSYSTDTAVLFNGSTGYVYTTQTYTNLTNLSIEAWVKTTGSGPLVSFESNQTGISSVYYSPVLYIDGANGKLTFYVYNGAGYTITSPSAINDGSWHHVVATMGAAGIVLYLDGVSVANNASPTSNQSFTGYWRIASSTNSSSGQYLSGTIDEVSVYNSTLSAFQVSSHYLAGISQRSCLDILQNGQSTGSGIYIINPPTTGTIRAYCDMTNFGGGWTLIAGTDGSTLNTPVVSSITSTSAAGVLSSTYVIPLAKLTSTIAVSQNLLNSGNVFTSTATTPLTQLRNYQVLNNSALLNASTNTDWSPTSPTNMTFTCTPTGGYNAALSTDIYHACGNGTNGFHWIPGSQICFSHGGVCTTVSLHLWIK